jgi:hypothetical protein
MIDNANGSTSGRLAKKLLMPVVATAVSAAASYAGKRAPKLIEEKVMPKVREAASSSEDLAGSLADRAKAVVGGSGGDGRVEPSRSSGLSDREREEKRRARAEQRQARRSGSRS